jgi:hypothetical protein
VVLATRPKTKDFHSKCHVGITPIARRREFDLSEISPAELTILQFEQHIRLGIGDYVPHLRTCIGIYSNHRVPKLDIIGRVDPSAVYLLPLTDEVGDGSDGRFPLCGPITPSLGFEAVVSWRRTHEPEAWADEVAKSRAEFEEHERCRLEYQRAKRKARSKAGT